MRKLIKVIFLSPFLLIAALCTLVIVLALFIEDLCTHWLRSWVGVEEKYEEKNWSEFTGENATRELTDEEKTMILNRIYEKEKR